MRSEAHVLGEPEQIDYPGGKDGFYFVRCTCGYRTSYFADPGHALRAARDHQRALEDRRAD